MAELPPAWGRLPPAPLAVGFFGPSETGDKIIVLSTHTRTVAVGRIHTFVW